MSKNTTIIEAADKATTALCKQLGDDAASCALAIALGKLCAETGLSLDAVIAMAEISHRETSARMERDGSPVAA
jgi:hypothetical protein